MDTVLKKAVRAINDLYLAVQDEPWYEEFEEVAYETLLELDKHMPGFIEKAIEDLRMRKNHAY